MKFTHLPLTYIPYSIKILHGIKFYSFTVSAITVKFNSIKYYTLLANAHAIDF